MCEYMDLVKGQKKLCNMKVTEILIVVRARKHSLKVYKKYLKNRKSEENQTQPYHFFFSERVEYSIVM